MHYVEAKGILSVKNGMNLYRGCSHGCIYCDPRSSCYHMDHDFEDIEAKVQGIICFGMGPTLRDGNREYFYQQLEHLFPELKEQYIREYGNQYSIISPNSRKLMQLFHTKCREHGIMHDNEQIFQYLQQFEEKDSGKQMDIWDFL